MAPLQLAIVGRPNVGKSTLVNRLLGAERMVTGPEAGITRDAITINWLYRERPIRLIDTAGLRRRARIAPGLEALAGADTLRAIRFAHVVVIVLDATQGLDRQDLTIARLVVDEGRAPVMALNKWDAVPDPGIRERILERLETSLSQARGIRLITLSALGGSGVDRLLPAVLAAYDTWNRQIPTGALNRWLATVSADHPHPSVQGRPVKVRYMTQAKNRPPLFVLFANRPQDVGDAYLRYLANGLRDAFDLAGVPIRFQVRRTRNPYAEP